MVWAGGLALAAALFVSPASAGHKHAKHHKQRHEQHQKSKHHGYADHESHPSYLLRHYHQPVSHGAHGHRTFLVPPTIHPTDLGVYSAYYEAQVYYGPHRHYHTVYRFPVRASVGYVYQPHFYCGQEPYHGQVTYHGPRLSVALRF